MAVIETQVNAQSEQFVRNAELVDLAGRIKNFLFSSIKRVTL